MRLKACCHINQGVLGSYEDELLITLPLKYCIYLYVGRFYKAMDAMVSIYQTSVKCDKSSNAHKNKNLFSLFVTDFTVKMLSDDIICLTCIFLHYSKAPQN